MNTFLQRFYFSTASAGMLAVSTVSTAFAQGFGLDDVNVNDLANSTDEAGIKGAVVEVINIVLNFLALIAVVVVIIAGIRLIISQGEEEAKEKAKKTIFYALIGLVIVLFAKVIVGLVADVLVNAVN